MQWLELLSIRQPDVFIIFQVMHILHLSTIPQEYSFGNPSACRACAAAGHPLTVSTGVQKPMEQLLLVTLDTLLCLAQVEVHHNLTM